jgi:hypothetical protein
MNSVKKDWIREEGVETVVPISSASAYPWSVLELMRMIGKVTRSLSIYSMELNRKKKTMAKNWK